MSQERPRVLIEEWLPAAAIGVECMRERGSASALAPTTYLHVWWARRPLVASRAAVLGSILPANFPRDLFERLLGFWASSDEIVLGAQLLEAARTAGKRIPNPHGERAFKNWIAPADATRALQAAHSFWRSEVRVLDPMAGGGSIPLESARLGFHTIANEYIPVACSITEVVADYAMRLGQELASKAPKWGKRLR